MSFFCGFNSYPKNPDLNSLLLPGTIHEITMGAEKLHGHAITRRELLKRTAIGAAGGIAGAMLDRAYDNSQRIPTKMPPLLSIPEEATLDELTKIEEINNGRVHRQIEMDQIASAKSSTSLLGRATNLAPIAFAALGIYVPARNELRRRREERLEARRREDEIRFADITSRLTDEQSTVKYLASIELLRFTEPGYEAYAQRIFNLTTGFLKERVVDPENPTPTRFEANLITSFIKVLEPLRDTKIDERTEAFKKYQKQVVRGKEPQETWSGADIAKEVALSLDASEIHLDGANLAGANLSMLNLRGASFRNALLNSSSLYGALLPKADFTNAKLENAFLLHANLQGAMIDNATLDGASCIDADFENALFQNLSFTVGTLIESVFQGTHFINVDFTSRESLNPHDRLKETKSLKDAQIVHCSGITEEEFNEIRRRQHTT